MSHKHLPNKVIIVLKHLRDSYSLYLRKYLIKQAYVKLLLAHQSCPKLERFYLDFCTRVEMGLSVLLFLPLTDSICYPFLLKAG